MGNAVSNRDPVSERSLLGGEGDSILAEMLPGQGRCIRWESRCAEASSRYCTHCCRSSASTLGGNPCQQPASLKEGWLWVLSCQDDV